MFRLKASEINLNDEFSRVCHFGASPDFFVVPCDIHCCMHKLKFSHEYHCVRIKSHVNKKVVCFKASAGSDWAAAVLSCNFGPAWLQALRKRSK